MKVKTLKYSVIFGFVFYFFFLTGCSKEGDRQKALNMITAKTLGLAYIEEDKLPEAESAFKELIALAPNEALGYANLGLVYIRMGDYQKAEKQLQKALEIEPNDPEIQLNLAEVFSLTNQNEKAINLLEETLRYHPDQVTSRILIVPKSC
jgi:tetratricopeptide (TPR) repeat protein